jgi:hypothetical protein
VTVFPEIFWSSHEISFICKQESGHVGELSEDIYDTPNIIVSGPSAQMCYLFEEMTWDCGAFSGEKERVGLGGSRMGTKGNDCKSGKTVFMGLLQKKIETYCCSDFFFFKFWRL